MATTYTQLSIIERWRHSKVPVDEMARVLKRCRSTIFRELKRNHFNDGSMPKHDGYYGAAAQLMTADQACRSITFDRGSKFMDWPHLHAEIGTQTWFCDPSSPCQKGTVENTKRRARRWLPSKRDIR